MKYSKYPSYKDSGVEWLGEIPSHWAMKKTKYLFNLIMEPAHSNNDYELLSIYTNIGVKPRKELEAKGNKASSTDGYWKVKKNDIIVNKLLAWMGAIGISEYEGVTSPAYDILRANKDVNAYFYSLLFRTKQSQSEFKKYSRGIMEMRLRLYFSEFGQIKIPLPSLEEQVTIVKYLNEATMKIDTLIAKQTKLIELLKEKRQVVISTAVTRGLDNTVAMKNSGVEWLGEIPEHWVKVSMKWISNIYSGGTPDKANLSYWIDGTIPWINSGEVNQFYITKPTTYITQEAYLKSSAKWIEADSLVMALAGQGKTKGMVARLGIRTTCNQSMAVIETVSEYESRFLLWWITANYQRIRNMAGGDLRDGLNLDLLGNIPCPFMSLKEQVIIAEYLDDKTSKIDKLIAKSTKAINLLKEKKSALISSAVTGKIDVREAV